MLTISGKDGGTVYWTEEFDRRVGKPSWATDDRLTDRDAELKAVGQVLDETEAVARPSAVHGTAEIGKGALLAAVGRLQAAVGRLGWRGFQVRRRVSEPAVAVVVTVCATKLTRLDDRRPAAP